MSIQRRLLWALVGATASKMARKKTHKALHTPTGAPRLPHAVRDQNGLVTAVVLAVATGALMALGDVLKEQSKDAAGAGRQQ